MELSNVDAIYAENPFLEKIIPRIQVSIAQVKRWDDVFLNSPNHDAVLAKIYLVDEDGDVVARVGTRWDYFFTALGRVMITETVAQTLARIGEDQGRRVHYAVGVGSWVILYKLPRGYKNAVDWVQARIEENRKHLI
jgi:hypothetical protein